MIHRFGIVEAELDGEDAVGMAFVNLHEQMARDTGHTCREDSELPKLFHRAVRDVILRQRRESQAVKRGGAGRTATGRRRRLSAGSDLVTSRDKSCLREEAELDALVSEQASAEDTVAARLDFQSLLKRLGDPHRTILVLLTESYTIQEIAARLGVDRKTVRAKSRKSGKRIGT